LRSKGNGIRPRWVPPDAQLTIQIKEMRSDKMRSGFAMLASGVLKPPRSLGVPINQHRRRLEVVSRFIPCVRQHA
jgi:hypothetical protein